MKIVFFGVFSLLICLSLAAVATETEYDNPQVFNYPFDHIWKTTIFMIQKQGMIVREMDKTSGFIATDWKNVGGEVGAILGKTLTGEVPMQRMTFSIIPVSEVETSVQVKIEYAYQNTFGRMDTVQYATKEQLENEEIGILKGIDLALVMPPVKIGIEPGYSKSKNKLKISKVLSHSPAKEAGLKIGDVILRVNGIEVTTEKEFFVAMKDLKAGDAVVVSVLRGKEPLDISVTCEGRTE